MNKEIHGDQEEVVDVGTNVAPSLNDKKTVADLIQERDQQLEQLDKLEDIQNADMLNTLENDNAASSKVVVNSAKLSESQSTAASGTSTKAKTYEYNPDYDVDKLREEKEA